MLVRLDSPFGGALDDEDLPQLRFEHVDVSADLPDVEVLEQAADDGVDAFAFLGRDILAQPGVVGMAAQGNLCVIVTHSQDPITATDHLKAVREELLREIGPGRLLVVLAAGVRALDLPATDPSKMRSDLASG